MEGGSGATREAIKQGLVLALAVAGVIALIILAIWAFPSAAHDGRVAGNLAMAVSAVVGLGGLALAWQGRRPGWTTVRAGATVALILATAYLALGSLQGNAKWALPAWRAIGYAGTLGAALAAEWLLRRYDDGLEGLAGRAAVMAGFAVVAFEVSLALGPTFDLPGGGAWSLELYRWQESTRAFWLAGCWSIYSLAVMAAGVWLRAPATRMLAAGLFGFTLAYTLLFGLFNLAAGVWLRAGGMAAVVMGTLVAGHIGDRAQGQRRPRERMVYRLLAGGALLVALVWAARELVWR